MAKVKKQKKKRKIGAVPSGPVNRGIDLGDQTRVAALVDGGFNDALRQAGVFGCAYGVDRIDGTKRSIPAITLVGENSTGFVKAFQHFERWGCLEDGDAVDVTMLLKKDGTYDLWIGPETQRVIYRTLPQADLQQALALNISWIKQFDTTHDMVRDLKGYCASEFHPVKILAAVTDPKRPNMDSLRMVRDWKGIVKFDLCVVDEHDEPADPRFQLGISQKRNGGPGERELGPTEICRRRNKTLDCAFPVSRERVRRSSLLASVRALNGFEAVCEAQVVQAAINLTLSDFLVRGDRHYSQVKGDWVEAVWRAAMEHADLADGELTPANQPAETVARQIVLDVDYALRNDRAASGMASFEERQALFLEKGYVNE